MVDNIDHLSFPTGVTFVTPFLLVYGTLRLGQSNYTNLIPHAKHCGTFKLYGWKLAGIICGYTGNEADYMIVDLFNIGQTTTGEVQTVLKVYELNYLVDRLEGAMTGGYRPTMFKLDVPSVHNEPIYAKLYDGRLNVDNAKAATPDFVSAKYVHYPVLNVLEIFESEITDDEIS